LKSDAIKQNNKIISTFEIFALFIAFIAIFVLLFPKEKLGKDVLTDKSNVDLTIAYLKNLVKIEPKNRDLLLAMASSLHLRDNNQKALKLLKELENSKDINLQSKATILHIQINQEKIDKQTKEKEILKLEKINRQLLSNISNKPITNLNINKKLYNIALSLHDKKSALHFVLNILNNKKLNNRIYWLKNAHYISDALNRDLIDIQILKELTKLDHNKSSLWLSVLIYKLPKNYDLASLMKELSLEKGQIASLYMIKQQSKKAVTIYKDLLNKTNDKREKIYLIKKIIKILQANNQTIQAATFAHDYESYFIKNKNLRKKIIKLYLGAGKTTWAREFSLAILKIKDQK